MADGTASTNVTDIEFKISINKTCLATPGDKRKSQVITVSEDFKGCTLTPNEFHTSKDDLEQRLNYYGQELQKWFAKDDVDFARRSYFKNDIVPGCNVTDVPWVIRVDIVNEIDEEKKIDLRVNAHLSFDQDTIKIPYTLYKRMFNWTENLRNNIETKKQIIAVLGCAFYDYPEEISEQIHKLSALKKWINEWMKKNSTENDVTQIIKKYSDSRIDLSKPEIIYSHSRIPVSEIQEGTWIFPIYVIKDEKKKKLPVNIKVVVEWTSDATSQSSKTSEKTDSKTTDGKPQNVTIINNRSSSDCG